MRNWYFLDICNECVLKYPESLIYDDSSCRMSNGACRFSRSLARRRGTRMVDTGSQFMGGGLKLCRTGCQCSVFVSQKICVVSTIKADVRLLDWGSLRSPAPAAARRIRCAVMARRPLQRDRCTNGLLCITDCDAVGRLPDRLGNHFVVQHKVCRKTRRRTQHDATKLLLCFAQKPSRYNVLLSACHSFSSPRSGQRRILSEHNSYMITHPRESRAVIFYAC